MLFPASPAVLFASAVAFASTVASRSTLSKQYSIHLETKRVLDSRLANIHVSCASASEQSPNCDKDFVVTYGPCDLDSKHAAHHAIGELHNLRNNGRGSEARLVWIIPEDADTGGCLSAWSTGAQQDDLKIRNMNVAADQQSEYKLIGRSEKLVIHKRHRQWLKAKRDMGIKMNNASGIDAEGPWFDGVELLKDKEVTMVDVKKAKAKKIAIVGAGMGGLMTWLCLNMSGFHNLEIIEAGERLGGRVHTEYLQGGPFDYQYQEMGPMRFPESITYKGTNKTLPINDMKLVFQLADKLNVLNDFNSNYSIDFIPWIQTSDAGLYYVDGIKRPDGVAPTQKQVKNNPKKWTVERPKPPQLSKLEAEYNKIVADPKTIALAATNMFQAHKKYLDSGLNGMGGDDWSEFAYFHDHLRYSLNITDQFFGEPQFLITSSDSFWSDIYDAEYFGSTSWKTVDGGLNRIPYAFYPLVGNITTMSRSISALAYDSAAKKVTLSWKDSLFSQKTHNATYDYAMVSVPFSIVRGWRFPGTYFNPTTTDAIRDVPYVSACKVALQFRTRFWEHYADPILGSCSTNTDIPGIGNVCYPSYNLRAPGPGVMLASYIAGDWGNRLISLTDKEHAKYVLDAMAEIHGEVAHEQYTGRFARRCWLQDPLEGASWADPSAGQHKLYIPAYFKTENNVIFVGEHTSYTHAWIASALESAVRGSVQLMLEMGLVDEAKALTEEWMGRWISV